MSGIASHPGKPLGADDHLFRGAYSLIVNVVLTSCLGVGFWVAAARLFPSATVGRDSALISGMVFLSTVCSLNLGSSMLRFLPISKMSPARIVRGAYGVTVAVAVVGGTACVLVVPQVSRSYEFVRHNPALAVLWVAAVVSWSVFDLQDAVLTALRRAPWVPVENGVFALLKLAALPILLEVGFSHAVFVAWVVPVVLLLIPVNYLIFTSFIPNRQPRVGVRSPIEQFGRRGLVRFLVNDYLAMLFMQATSAVLPALALAIVGSRNAAYFYMAFLVVGAFDTLFFQVLSSMTVEAAMAPQRLSALLRSIVRRFGGPLIVGIVVLVAGANLILLPFGADYVQGGAHVLELLALGSGFRAVIDCYCAICRVRGTTGRLLAVQAVLSILVASLTVALGSADGVVGIGIAWLVGHAVTAVVVAPSVVKTMRARTPVTS